MNFEPSNGQADLNGVARPILVSACLTAAYLLGIAFNITPWLRGPQEWRWAYAVPGSLARLWLPALLLVAYVLLASRLHRRPLTRQGKIVALGAALLMTPALQLALLYMDHPDVRSPLFYRTVSESSGGFFNVGAVVTDTSDFLSHFSERMPDYPVHPQRHPPGLPLLFSGLRQFFDQHAGLAAQVTAGLRPYQCHNLPLMNLPDSAIASAVLQMAVPFLLGLVIWPLYRLGREMYDEPTAVRAILLWPLVPSVALWATRWNHLYAALTVSALLTFHFGLSRRKPGYFFLSGLIVSVGSFFNFGNAALAGLLGIYALVWLAAYRSRPSLGRLCVEAGLFAAGVGSLWIVLWFSHSVNLIDIWRIGIGTHLGLERSYATWLFYHLYDFFVFLGIPLCILWLSRIEAGIRRIRRRDTRVDVLAIAFAVGLLLLDVSGVSQGEVARVWAFLLPLPLLTAVSHLPQRSIVFASLAGLLAAQTLVSNIFLRPVGTGLSDPPAAPPAIADSGQPARATWANGVVLQSAQAPDVALNGQSIQVYAVWIASQPISRAYTIFVHLIDTQGNLVAQHDGMPLDGGWPTTCWQPGHRFQDSYNVIVPETLEPARYHLSIGLYWLPTLERLPLEGQDVTGDRSVEIDAIDVTGR